MLDIGVKRSNRVGEFQCYSGCGKHWNLPSCNCHTNMMFSTIERYWILLYISLIICMNISFKELWFGSNVQFLWQWWLDCKLYRSISHGYFAIRGKCSWYHSCTHCSNNVNNIWINILSFQVNKRHNNRERSDRSLAFSFVNRHTNAGLWLATCPPSQKIPLFL